MEVLDRAGFDYDGFVAQGARQPLASVGDDAFPAGAISQRIEEHRRAHPLAKSDDGEPMLLQGWARDAGVAGDRAVVRSAPSSGMFARICRWMRSSAR